MARFLLELSYTPDAWAAQLENPTNRQQAIKPALDAVGAKIEICFFAFGESDIVGIVEAPDNVSAAALSLCINASGIVRSAKTTPLMTMEEGMEAMRKGARALAVYPKLSKQMASAGRN
ncbi:MAG: GYD domain-containing protein [Vulcanimicrobiaceae bacterium]